MIRRPGGWIAALLLVSLGVLVGTVSPTRAAPGNEPGRRVGPLSVGQAPPALTLQRVSGTEAVTLPGLAGRVVVLDFWATWCGPCRAVMPALDDLYRRHRAQGLSVVGLSPENDTVIRAHLAQNHVDYTVARDIGGTMQRYGVRSIPTLVVLDRRGQVRDVVIGVDGPAMQRVESLVTTLLSQPAP